MNGRPDVSNYEVRAAFLQVKRRIDALVSLPAGAQRAFVRDETAAFLPTVQDERVAIDAIRRSIDPVEPHRVTDEEVMRVAIRLAALACHIRQEAQDFRRALADAEVKAAENRAAVNREMHRLYLDQYRGGSRHISESLRAEVVARSGGRCAACGKGGALQVDHIHPFCRGGQTLLGNLQALCQKCNGSKGKRDYHDWLEDRGLGMLDPAAGGAA